MANLFRIIKEHNLSQEKLQELIFRLSMMHDLQSEDWIPHNETRKSKQKITKNKNVRIDILDTSNVIRYNVAYSTARWETAKFWRPTTHEL